MQIEDEAENGCLTIDDIDTVWRRKAKLVDEKQAGA